MQPKEFEANCEAMIFKISVITGWQVPGGEHAAQYANALMDQLKKKIVDDYQDLNKDEFEYAMRQYGTQIKDWGKAMNLSLIDEAINIYLTKRRMLSDFESQATQKKQLSSSEVIFDWKENCENAYQDYLKGKLNIILMPVDLYSEFESCGYISTNLFEEYLAEAEVKLLHDLNIELLEAKLGNNPPKAKELAARVAEISESEELHPTVINAAKKLAVIALFDFSKESGIKNLFVKENT